jgi:hypothetical protein
MRRKRILLAGSQILLQRGPDHEMEISHSSRSAVGICAAISILAGCGGSQAQLGTPATIQSQSAAMAGRAESRIAHNAATDTKFTVSGRSIYLNGKKFFVKGMDYWPTPIETAPWDPPGMDDALRNGNSAIWERDLPNLRAMGVNAVHVYNVVGPPYDVQTGPIFNFLDKAWNNGNRPIYVLLTIYFTPDKLLTRDADLEKQYYSLDKKYAAKPAVMGVILGNEVIKAPYWTNDQWWNHFNLVAESAKKGFADAGFPDKLVMTADHDATIDVDGKTRLAAIYYGEQHGAKVDVWGDNPYRGRTFTGLFDQIRSETTKPVLLTEYGATAAYHVDWKNTYSYPHDLYGTAACNPLQRAGPLNRDVAELPENGNPNMGGLVDLVTNTAKLIYDAYKGDGVVSGGFYLEWTDEWWKADSGNPAFKSVHVGDKAFASHFPGCSYDEGWWGLNAISKGSKRYLDTLTPRPTLAALRDTWKNQP